MAEVVSTNNPSTDPTNIQAAHDAAQDGDTIDLKQADKDTPFNLGTSTIVISKSLTIQGYGYGHSGKARIVGGGNTSTGAAAVMINAPAKDLEVRNLQHEEANVYNWLILQTRDLKMEGIRMLWETAQGHTVYSGALGLQTLRGMLIGSFAFPFGMTGQLEFSDMYWDFETGADAADPYDGARSVLNPAPTGEGGAWPGAGQVNPSSWASQGMFCGLTNPEGARLHIENSTVKNYTKNGIELIDFLGHGCVEKTVAQTPYGVHAAGQPYGSVGFIGFSGFFSFVPEVQTIHGHYSFHNNKVIDTGRTNAGIWTGAQNPFKPMGANITQNHILLTGGSYGLLFWPCDVSNISQNKLRGTADYGAFFGFPGDVRTYGTDRNAIVKNNFKDFDPIVADMYLSADTEENIVYGGNLKKEIVIDNGVNNTIVGVNATRKDLTQEQQDLLDWIMNNGFVCYDDLYTE